MISDEQGKEWLLQKLYDEGWRYLYGDYYGTTCLADKEPKTDRFGSIIPGGDHRSIGLTKPFFSELKINQILNIAEELGVVDWSEVSVDTPIIVTTSYGDDINMHFAKFENGFIYYYSGGRTSWTQTTIGTYKTTPKCVRLAGDTDE